MPTIVSISRRVVWGLLLLLGAAAFLHLNADFPHHSRWIDDSARYTDEGWYASGALNHILTGHWLREGDFNPVVTIPVWSALLEVIFHFAGISLALARALAVLFMAGTVLTAGLLMGGNHRRLAPAFMLLLGASPLLFFFSRSAILESPLLFFLTASALAANTSRPPWLRSVSCGLLFALAMMVKSSAPFVAPAIFYLLWFRNRQDKRRLVRAIFLPFLTVLACYGCYWLLCIHSHAADFRTLHGENRLYLGVRSIEKAIRVVYRSITWLDPVFFPLAVFTVAMSFGRLRMLWREPLFGFAILWYLGYSAFLVVHFDAGPHYFAMLVLPTMLLVVLLLDALEQEQARLGNTLGALALLVVVINVGYIVKLMLHPDYTLQSACLHIRQQIDADPAATPLVIGHGAMQTTYYTHIPALDDIGSMPVSEKLAVDHPGWFVTYSDNLALTIQPGVPGNYTFIEKGSYPVFDNPDRRSLLLYRIEKK
jgi:4-amino-4-deoxy-L-arabinose transferase-like glycosyltransferase